MKLIELNKYRDLKLEYENLSKYYIKLIEEQEDVIYKEKNYLESIYLSNFGYLIKTKLNINIKIREIKRKISLIQYYINRDEKVNINKINEIIESEMIIFNEQVKALENQIKYGKKLLKSRKLDEEEIINIKKIFRTIAKKLHPDLNKNVTEEMKKLLERAIRAYDINDIDTLKSILSLIKEDKNISDLEGISTLEEDIENIKVKIKDIINLIENINVEFPFNIKEDLEDDVFIQSKKQELNMDISLLNKELEKYSQKLVLMEGTYLNE